MPLSVMSFIFLCFLGIVVIFFFAMRGLEKIHADMRDDHAQLRVMLRAMESRLSHPPMDYEARSAAESRPAFESRPVPETRPEPEMRPAPEVRPTIEIRPTAEMRPAPESRQESYGPPESLSFGPSTQRKTDKQSGELRINID